VARHYPEREAIVDRGTRLTFRQWDDSVGRLVPQTGLEQPQS